MNQRRKNLLKYAKKIDCDTLVTFEPENLFYLTGSILMISNFIAKKDPTIGFSIIAATFIYNQILIDNQ